MSTHAEQSELQDLGIVFGPASATDTAIPRFNGTTGKLLQNSSVVISGLGVLSGGSIADAMVSEANVTQHVPKVFSVYKASNTDRDTTTTLADDPDLVITPDVSKNYIVTGMIVIVSDTTPDFKFEFGGPSSGATLKLSVGGGIAAGSTSKNFKVFTAFSQSKNYPIASTNEHLMWISGIITIGSTSGDVAFRWAQQTSSATVTTVETGSWLRMEII